MRVVLIIYSLATLYHDLFLSHVCVDVCGIRLMNIASALSSSVLVNDAVQNAKQIHIITDLATIS